MHLLRNKLVKSDFFSFSLLQATGQWPGRLALIMFGDRTKKPLPIAIWAVAMNSKTGGKLKLKNSLIRITILGGYSVTENWKVLKCQDMPKFQLGGGGVFCNWKLKSLKVPRSA